MILITATGFVQQDLDKGSAAAGAEADEVDAVLVNGEAVATAELASLQMRCPQLWNNKSHDPRQFPAPPG